MLGAKSPTDPRGRILNKLQNEVNRTRYIQCHLAFESFTVFRNACFIQLDLSMYLIQYLTLCDILLILSYRRTHPLLILGSV